MDNFFTHTPHSNNYSRNYSKGKSFKFSEWNADDVYNNDEFIQDFVKHDNKLWACVAPVSNHDAPSETNRQWSMILDGVADLYFQVPTDNPNKIQWKYGYDDSGEWNDLIEFDTISEDSIREMLEDLEMQIGSVYDSELSETSINAVQNRIITEKLNQKADKSDLSKNPFEKGQGENSAVLKNGQNTAGNFATALGELTTASGYGSVAEGYGTEATESMAHAEGYYTDAKGKYSHAEGHESQALDFCSHAEGATTIAKRYAHSEGRSTQANGECSHSEGLSTIADGECSHSEGRSTKAIGKTSHVEGRDSQSVGESSHAEGSGSVANGKGSHAEGIGTIANNEAEHASGKYNVSNTDTQFSIGIGTSKSVRKNAFEVKQNGDIYIEGVEGRIQDKLNTSQLTNDSVYLNHIAKTTYNLYKSTDSDALKNAIISLKTGFAISQYEEYYPNGFAGPFDIINIYKINDNKYKLYGVCNGTIYKGTYDIEFPDFTIFRKDDIVYINADWNANSSSQEGFIKNKPFGDIINTKLSYSNFDVDVSNTFRQSIWDDEYGEIIYVKYPIYKTDVEQNVGFDIIRLNGYHDSPVSKTIFYSDMDYVELIVGYDYEMGAFWIAVKNINQQTQHILQEITYATTDSLYEHDIIHKINPNYIPDNYATKTDIADAIAEAITNTLNTKV